MPNALATRIRIQALLLGLFSLVLFAAIPSVYVWAAFIISSIILIECCRQDSSKSNAVLWVLSNTFITGIGFAVLGIWAFITAGSFYSRSAIDVTQIDFVAKIAFLTGLAAVLAIPRLLSLGIYNFVAAPIYLLGAPLVGLLLFTHFFRR